MFHREWLNWEQGQRLIFHFFIFILPKDGAGNWGDPLKKI
jgi:hypothetical protein